MSRIVASIASLHLSIGLLTLLACGGGGSSSDPANIIWKEGVFQNESQFKNYCQVPRSGTDLNGNTFPDRQGSTLQENNWLRSWSNNTYLWYDEIQDQDPLDFASPADYFDVLITNELTLSGNRKDRFHFTYDTDEWQQLNQSGQSASYGAEFNLIAARPPRQIVVAYTLPATPATENNNLMRGTEILTADGENISDSSNVDVLNAALFPNEAGETHTFTVRDVGSSDVRSITMSAQIITEDPVLKVSTIATNNGNLGYLVFNSHVATAEESLVNAVNQLKAANVNELVLDMRYNGGGLLAIASELAYMIAGNSTTSGKQFDNLTFNDKHTSTDPVTGRTLEPTPFYDKTLGFSLDAGATLPTLNLNRLIILTTSGTCSASESIINGLQGIDLEVILIGGTTCGKPYGFYPTDNCGTTYFTIQFRGANDKGFGDYADGFSPANTPGTVGSVVPGCYVEDDYSHPLGDPQEAMLAAATDYIATGSCPALSGNFSQSQLKQFNPATTIEDNGPAISNPHKLKEMILGLPGSRQ